MSCLAGGPRRGAARAAVRGGVPAAHAGGPRVRAAAHQAAAHRHLRRLRGQQVSVMKLTWFTLHVI